MEIHVLDADIYNATQSVTYKYVLMHEGRVLHTGWMSIVKPLVGTVVEVSDA